VNTLHRMARRNLFSSFSGVRAVQRLSGLILASLGSMMFSPSAFGYWSSVDSYFEQHPEEIVPLAEAMAESQGTVAVTGPSAPQFAPSGAVLAFLTAQGRLSLVQGYSPDEIQKGLQKLAERYCLRNPVDCYGPNNWIYTYYSPNNFRYTWANSDAYFGTNRWCDPAGVVFNYPGAPPGECIDMSTLKVAPREGNPKKFSDLTPEQKRKAIRLATPADFIPNPGTFDIPDDGTKLIPGQAPIFTPDPSDRDKLKPVKTPLPTTTASQNSGGGGTQDPGTTPSNPNNGGNTSGDPAQEIADHIDGDRLRELGFPGNVEGLKEWVDNTIDHPAEVWERVPDPTKPKEGQEITTAYVDSEGRVVIDNPAQPTAVRPYDYKDYLTRDKFNRVE
jgi:hypothetical protein